MIKETNSIDVLGCFKQSCYTLTWKIIKTLHGYTDSVNVNTALNLNFYEKT